jgi:hypothetical protein
MGQLLRDGDPGLYWADVVFENLVVHVRSSIVMIVQDTPKTEPSAKDVPLDTALAESLFKMRLTSTSGLRSGRYIRTVLSKILT